MNKLEIFWSRFENIIMTVFLKMSLTKAKP